MTYRILRLLGVVVLVTALCMSGIVASPASALSAPAVTVTPNVVGEQAKYTIEFTLGADLAAGDEIWLYFPPGTYLPCTSCNPRILQTTVTVNGSYPLFPSIGNATSRIVQVYSPKPLKAGEKVTVIIDSSAGVRNPLSGGAYKLGISTTRETQRVDSAAFPIGASRISSVVVHQTDSNISGTKTGYMVNIVTGYGGALAAGQGTVTLTFPEGTAVPAAVEPGDVSVNGVACRRVECNPTTRSIVITVPTAINAVDLLTVTLPASVGLTNPAKRGEYTLFAHTSAEDGDVRSDPYSVQDAPAVATVLAVTPPAPEGEDMWYLHAPMVALAAQSNREGTVTTWYAVDDAPLASYTQPFQMPDGIHVLRYMSKNETAGIEEELRTKEFKVEVCAPAVTFAEGSDSILTNQSPLVLHGKVEACASGIASVEIAGQPVTITTLQEFTSQLKLVEGKNDVSVLARTKAGNTRLTTLEVVLDTTAPAITVTSHKNWETVTTSTIVVKGQAEADAAIVLNGSKPIVPAPDGSFQETVTLTEGQNVIAFTATDKAGNRRTASVVVLYEPAQKPRTTVVLTVGSPAMTFNGVTIAVDVNPLVVPVVKSGRTLVPVRGLMQVLGGDVAWNAASREVTIRLGGHTLVLTIGKPSAVLDGGVVPIDAGDSTVVPLIINGRTMLPVRFVVESVGGSVTWNAARRTVTVVYPKP